MALFTEDRLIGALGRIISILEENRELLKENRDLLKSSDEYFKERKRWDGLHAERLAREDMERRIEKLTKICHDRWVRKYPHGNGNFVVEGSNIIHKLIYTDPDHHHIICQLDGLWFYGNKMDFSNPDSLDRTKSFKSPEDAVEAYLVSRNVT